MNRKKACVICVAILLAFSSAGFATADLLKQAHTVNAAKVEGKPPHTGED